MIKKILGIGFIVVFIGAIIWYYMTFVYVPKGEEFDIKFLNIDNIKVEGEPKQEKAEFTKNGFYTRTKFVTSDEELYYKFDVMNDGTLDAVLKFNPIFTKTDMYFKKHIKYKITYIDDSEVKAGDTLNAGETKTFKVAIKYTKSDSPTQNSEFYESNVLLVYVRK